MSYQVLARKWRPKSFDELVGQEHVSQALVNGLDQDRLHHAFLFTGTRGIGKTTIARILAKCLNCEQGMSSKPCGECGSCVDLDEGRFVDMIEIDAASRTGVEDMRELLESVQYSPTRGRFKIYIIDEVHMLSASSFNALLKTLEEPPPHVKFVLATTDPQKIPVTILSRCLRFNLRRLLPDQIRAYLETLVASENIEAEPEALSVLARAADGSMRDGLSLLDQAIAFGGGRLDMADLEKMLGLVDHEHVASIICALAEGDAEAMLRIVEDLVSQSRDLDSVLLNLAEVLHRVTLAQCVPGYRDAERSDWPAIEQLAASLSAEDAQLYYQIAIKGRKELGLAPDPRTGLEMTLLRMLAFRPAEGSGSPPEGGPARGRRGEAASTPVRAEPVVAAAPPAKKTGGQISSATLTPVLQESRPEAKGDSEWLTIIEQLNITALVRELARNIELTARSGDTWDFLIEPALKNLGSRDSIEKLQQAISEMQGHPVRIRISDGSKAPAKTAAAKEQKLAHQTMSEAERAINEDPTVKALKDEMGARIIEDSIQPIQ